MAVFPANLLLPFKAREVLPTPIKIKRSAEDDFTTGGALTFDLNTKNAFCPLKFGKKSNIS